MNRTDCIFIIIIKSTNMLIYAGLLISLVIELMMNLMIFLHI